MMLIHCIKPGLVKFLSECCGVGLVTITDYIYIVDLKKESCRLPPARLLSPDSRKYLCGSKQSFEEGGGGVQGVNEHKVR